MLDEGFRRRVGRLASWDDTALDEAVRERILRKVAAEGPALAQRARRVRFLMLSAGPVLAAAAAILVLVNHRAGEHRAPSASVVSTGQERGPRLATAAAPPDAHAKACSSRPVVAGGSRAFEPTASGARLDLGVTALAVAEPGAEVRLADAAACRTIIALDRGAVAVHAKDLGGGELTVRARDGEVTVHGTIFSVAQAPDSLVVEVVEGRVAVRDRAGEHFVTTGQRLALSASGVASGVVSAEREAALRAAVEAPKVVGFETLVPAGQDARDATKPARTAAAGARAEDPGAPAAPIELGETAEPAAPVDLLAAADEARHRGDHARARELYQRAASGTGATAEAAWVALARMELALGNAVAAREATKQRRGHFGQGTLAPEALWIDVRTYRQTGELGRARELAAELARAFPSSPQAQAARQWLAAP